MAAGSDARRIRVVAGVRVLSLLLFTAIRQAHALEVDGVTLYTREEPPPAAVLEQVTCQAAEDLSHASRRPFGRGYVFTAPCPGNHANAIEAVVFAQTAEGADARLLRFPRPPGRGEPADSLSNIRWDPQRRELTELFVNPEERICRSEGRWRIDGAKPRLVFWRETRDCKGKRGWRVVFDRRG